MGSVTALISTARCLAPADSRARRASTPGNLREDVLTRAIDGREYPKRRDTPSVEESLAQAPAPVRGRPEPPGSRGLRELLRGRGREGLGISSRRRLLAEGEVGVSGADELSATGLDR